MKTTTDFRPLSDRYEFDCGPCSYANGFAQVDTQQDAPYYDLVLARQAHHRELLRGRRDQEGMRDRR